MLWFCSCDIQHGLVFAGFKGEFPSQRFTGVCLVFQIKHLILGKILKLFTFSQRKRMENGLCVKLLNRQGFAEKRELDV